MAKFMLHYTLPNVWKIGPIRFMPGINEVDSAVWDKVKDHPLLKERFDKGALVWVRGPKEAAVAMKTAEPMLPPSSEDEDALAGTTVDEAKKIVADTLDLSLLKVWSESETRKGVLKAINEQIEKVTPKEGDYREQKDGDDGK